MYLSADLAQLATITGRVLLGGLFVLGGIEHFTSLPAVSGAMAKRGVPMAHLVLIAGSLFQIACGALLMLGLWVTAAALGLVVFTLAASAIFMNFWSLQGEARAGAIGGWKTNLALIGGLLVAAASNVL
ncbi:DoxX family protein [Luteimonas sp. SX5]|uniref:DoxX family protein n=2 Tax=Luteimonas galliterrae TaxID=2940486 RepID=A0ABT0MFK1_9GAMM|nr:DoxX family protein [Luteimonas galliterrae]